MKAAKAALINFYETLRFEVKDEVGITIATHGWMGTEMTRGRFMVEEGAEMQWKEEREVSFYCPYHKLCHFTACINSLVPELWLYNVHAHTPFLSIFIFQVQVTGGPVEEFAKLIVEGACRGNACVKYPSWYDVFFVFRVFSPNVLQWTFQFLSAHHVGRRTSFIGTGRPLLGGSPPRKLLTGPSNYYSQAAAQQQLKMEWEKI